MRILFFHRWVGVHAGGTETHLLMLANGLSNLGHEVSILTRQGRMLNDLGNRIKVIRVSKNLTESDHSYEDIRLYLHTGLFILKSLICLFYLHIKGKRFDVISVHFATEALVARIFRFFTKTPFVFILEGYTPLEANTSRYAQARIAISEFEAKMYRDNHNLKVEVIPIGIEVQKFQSEKSKAASFRKNLAGERELIVLTVCRLEPRKDLSTLIEAADLAAKIMPGLKFIIAGDGISRAMLEKIVQDKRLETTVRLMGFVSEQELPFYYSAADIFVLTSVHEWFGIVFLEAMAAGLPIISTDVDACPEVVGDCGLYFKAGDYRTLSGLIIKLAQGPSLRQELSEKSFKRAREFEWKNLLRRYETVYLNIIKNN